MKKITIILSASLLLIGCGEQPGLKKTLGENTWRFTDPQEAQIGAWGIRTVISPTNIKFDNHGLITKTEIPVRISKRLKVQYNSEEDAKAELSQSQIGGLGITYQNSVDSGFEIVKTSLKNKEQYTKIIREDIQSSNTQKYNSDSVRIITSVASVYNHKSVNDYNASFEGDFNATKKIDGTIVSSASGKSKVILEHGNGSIVAYQYARLCWDNKGDLVYIQEEAPNHFLFGWFNSFDCPEGTLIKRPISGTN